MKRTLFFLLLSAGLLGCSIPGPPVLSRSLPADLPTSHEFQLSPDDIKSKIMLGLKTVVERDSPFYQKYGFRDPDGQHSFVPFLAEDKQTALFGKTFFEDPANADCLYVHSMGAAVQSAQYYTRKGPVSYAVEFAVSIERKPNHSGTLVSVKSFNTMIFNGIEFPAGHGLYAPKAIPVAPVKVEEYKLLAYIAHLLGVHLQPLAGEK
jgi:hypothetical protein